MRRPRKPFGTYKWRWLSVQPTEGLLVPPVFLGVLRVLGEFEGERYSSEELQRELKRVEDESGTSVTLARDPERNLFRNSGQYWRGTGLVVPGPGHIELTRLGHSLASGELTVDEFAALMIRNTVIPNPLTYSDDELKKWRDANLRIKPLQVILQIITILEELSGNQQSYLTPNELIKVVIPLVGDKRELEEISESLLAYRNGDLDVSSWPDCAPEANDKRLAREFLLFLENFGVCECASGDTKYDATFSLSMGPLDEQFKVEGSFLEDEGRLNDEVEESKRSILVEEIERRRVATTVLHRPGQSEFRKAVVLSNEQGCVFTKERTLEVLEAAHIVPVKYGGTDSASNGLCMRVDIHRLFDAGKIRIDSEGAVTINGSLRGSRTYSRLPDRVTLKDRVDPAYLKWRMQYL